MQARTLSLVLLLVGATGAFADDMKMPVNASQLEWAPAPNFVPEGAQITVLSGDPSKDGPYVIRLKMPAGYKIPAHNHPTTEMVTVISGDFHLGMGDKLDEEKGVLLTAGGYAEAPAHMNHYAWASSPATVQVHGQGPFGISYVNPTDDPRNKPQASK
jgi:anti-sigma factor ChrR (cupin superfamily)